MSFAGSEEDVKKCFAIFDVDGSGTMNARELRPLVKTVIPDGTDEEIDFYVKQFIGEADADRDNIITYEEFKKVMMAP